MLRPLHITLISRFEHTKKGIFTARTLYCLKTKDNINNLKQIQCLKHKEKPINSV